MRSCAGVAIVGCGDVGRRLARRWLERGAHVTGLVKSVASVEKLGRAGITAVQVDLDDSTWEPTLGSLVYYLAPPPPAGALDGRMRRFLKPLADGVRLTRVVLISTSGVYGDCGGSWVDETAPLRPDTDRSRRRVDAEQTLRQWGNRVGCSIVVLRVPGIYGPGRLPIERLRRGITLPEPEQSPYTNRIHVDDLVTACMAAAAVDATDAIFNVADNRPERMSDYFLKVARLAGVSPPMLVSLQEAKRAASPMLRGYLSASRRLNNTKMRTELGVTLRYPNLDAGLPECLDGPD